MAHARIAAGLLYCALGTPTGCLPRVPPSTPGLPTGGTTTSSSPSATQVAPSAPFPRPCEVGAPVFPTALLDPVRGSFSSAGLDEIAGRLDCGDFSAGAHVLARRTGQGGAFELVRVDEWADSRVSRTHCGALRTRSGRDLLICRDDAIAYGRHDQTIVVVDYARDQEHDTTRIISVSDTTDTSCGGASDVVTAVLEGHELVDLDGDGALDVRVKVGAARARAAPRPGCVMGTLGSGDPPRVPRPAILVVDFLLRGESLVVAPSSASTLATLRALAP